MRKILISVLVLFHLIGFLGMVFIDVEKFAQLSVYNLLLSLVLLLFGHTSSKSNFFKLLLPVFILGYLVELLGIFTGFPFGDYQYGEALGYKLSGVPAIIGVNWFLLVMGAGFFSKLVTESKGGQTFLASVIMVLVDFPIEHMASTLDYWHWAGNDIPFSNFIGWLFVSIIMQILFQKYMAKETNQLAIPYLVLVSIFFALLNLFL